MKKFKNENVLINIGIHSILGTLLFNKCTIMLCEPNDNETTIKIENIKDDINFESCVIFISTQTLNSLGFAGSDIVLKQCNFGNRKHDNKYENPIANSLNEINKTLKNIENAIKSDSFTQIKNETINVDIDFKKMGREFGKDLANEIDREIKKRKMGSKR